MPPRALTLAASVAEHTPPQLLRLAAAVSGPPPPRANDRDDPHDQQQQQQQRYTTSLRQRIRPEQAQAYYAGLRDYSRPSSSSGSALSASPSLRRKTRFEARPSTLRAYARDAGYRGVDVLPVEDFSFFRFYELTT